MTNILEPSTIERSLMRLDLHCLGSIAVRRSGPSLARAARLRSKLWAPPPAGLWCACSGTAQALSIMQFCTESALLIARHE